jgi:hypothetical protein
MKNLKNCNTSYFIFFVLNLFFHFGICELFLKKFAKLFDFIKPFTGNSLTGFLFYAITTGTTFERILPVVINIVWMFKGIV